MHIFQRNGQYVIRSTSNDLFKEFNKTIGNDLDMQEYSHIFDYHLKNLDKVVRMGKMELNV